MSQVQSPEQARPKPQKSTSSASKAEEREWLSKAREYVNMAHLNNPVYSGILQAIDAVLDGKTGESWQTRAESMLARLESQLSVQNTQTNKKPKKSVPPVQPTYAEVAKPTTTKTKATTTTDVPKKTKKSLQATTPVVSKERAKPQTKESQQLVLLIKKGQEIPPYSAMSIRDGINKAIAEKENQRGPVVGSVKTSTSGNIVITTITPYSANTLEKTLPVWRGVFKDFPIHSWQIQRPWIKLVAHGVPIEVADTFQKECQDYNPVRVKGAIRWLKKPTKPTGSMVFAVDTTTEQQHCLQKGLFIGGKRVTIVNFRTHSEYSQCSRCQGFGHDPFKCRHRIACKLCSRRHLTKSHVCTVCQASGDCPHLEPRCANCNGHHTANSEDCEILKAVRGTRNRPVESIGAQKND